MIRKKVACLVALGFAMAWGMVAGAGEAKVTVRVVADSLPDPQQVFLSGQGALLGDWKADGVPLEQQPDQSWVVTLPVPAPATLEFKVTRGSWATEALDKELKVPGNTVLEVTGDQTLQIAVPKWKDELPSSASGQVTGTLKYHRNMEGDGLLPRDVLVWLPPSYDQDPERRYPVLYMHDAQQVFDPATSTHGVDWGVDEAVTRLAADGLMQEIIVVATTCTSERFADYADGEKGKAYQRFMVQKLKPFIDQNYRTRPEREHTAVMGASMGGLASFLLAWRHPDVFSMAGCLSSAFWPPLLREVAAYDGPAKDVQLYMDNGGVGLERILQSGNDWMLEALQKKGFVLGQNLVWVQDAAAEHNEAAWAQRVWMPLRWFFGTGPQDWVAALPLPAAPLFAERDKEDVPVTDLPDMKITGCQASLGHRGRAEASQSWECLRGASVAAPDQPLEWVGLAWVFDGDITNYVAGSGVAPDSGSSALVTVDVPAGRYLEFQHPGDWSDMEETYHFIFGWWLPRHQYEAAGPVVERYSAWPLESTDKAVRVFVPFEQIP